MGDILSRKEKGAEVVGRVDFIRAWCEHQEARQKLDYWEMEVCCCVTLTVCSDGWRG